MPVNPNIQTIVDAVSDKLAQYTTPESINPQVVTEAIALAVQSLYTVPDVFMSNNNVSTIDFANYVNVERLFARQNPFTSLDLSPMVNLKYVEFSANDFIVKNIDFSNNIALENIIIEGLYGFSVLDFSMLPNLKKIHLEGNDMISDLSFISNLNNPILEDLSLGSFEAFSGINFNANIYPFLKRLNFGNTVIDSCDTSSLVSLEHLSLFGDTIFDITNNSNLSYLSISGHNNLTQLDYDNILSLLVSFGKNNGRLDLVSNSNINPSASGLTNQSILESRGWDIYLT